MTTKRLILIALTTLVPAVASAHGGPSNHPADPNLHVDPSVDDCFVRFAPELTQAAFARFAREFGSLSAFKWMAPPTTLGQWGAAIAVENMWFSIDEDAAAWNDTFVHPDAYHELGEDKSFPRLHARVGILDAFDVGLYYTENPTSNYGWFGIEGTYGLLRQDEAMPVSLAMRGAYTTTLYVDDLDMHAITTDVSVGRTFWRVFTPYVGIGNDLVLASETSDAVALESEELLAPHGILGFEVHVWYVALGAQAQVATIPSVQAQLAAVF